MFPRALKKHGFENFEWRVIFRTDSREKLDELERLQEDARKAPLAVTRDLDDGCALIDDRGVCIATTTWLTDARWFAAIHNAFPTILEYVRQMEGERDELRETIRAQEATITTLGAQAQARRNTRDARMKREGAAEWLEAYIARVTAENPIAVAVFMSSLKAEAKRLRESG